jgi:hypothetical protein
MFSKLFLAYFLGSVHDIQTQGRLLSHNSLYGAIPPGPRALRVEAFHAGRLAIDQEQRPCLRDGGGWGAGRHRGRPGPRAAGRGPSHPEL